MIKIPSEGGIYGSYRTFIQELLGLTLYHILYTVYSTSIKYYPIGIIWELDVSKSN